MEYQKKNIPKNIEKKNKYTGELHKKRYNFAPDAATHTFLLTHPVYKKLNDSSPGRIPLYFINCIIKLQINGNKEKDPINQKDKSFL